MGMLLKSPVQQNDLVASASNAASACVAGLWPPKSLKAK